MYNSLLTAGTGQNLRIILWAIENVCIPLDRAHQVVLNKTIFRIDIVKDVNIRIFYSNILQQFRSKTDNILIFSGPWFTLSKIGLHCWIEVVELCKIHRWTAKTSVNVRIFVGKNSNLLLISPICTRLYRKGEERETDR